MLTCREAATLLSQDVDGELSAISRATLQAHLAICKTCQQVKRQFRLLNSAIAQRDEEKAHERSPGLSDDAKQRLKNTMRRVDNDQESKE
jgi:predicted anti-sigma-YlaC factor YlaD